MSHLNGIDLAIKCQCPRAFAKLAALEAAKYQEAEAVFGVQVPTSEQEWAAVEDMFFVPRLSDADLLAIENLFS
jgi:hypothetical protein